MKDRYIMHQMIQNSNASQNRKKVLFIAYFYHNKEMVASNRTHAIYDYLNKFGWDVTLLTSGAANGIEKSSDSFNKIISVPHNPGFLKIYYKFTGKNSWGIMSSSSLSRKKGDTNPQGNSSINKVIQTINKSIQTHPRLNKICQNIFSLCSLAYFPDLYSSWYHPALKEALHELKSEKYDAVLSTSGPFTAHKIASKIISKTNLPWVADFRDPWSQREYATHQTNNLRKNLEQKYEIKIINTASYITTVSTEIADNLHNIHQIPTGVILNGFDPEKLNKGTPLRPKFTITHLGNLYEGKRNPEPLIRALAELIQSSEIIRDDISIDFYGSYDKHLDSLINKYDMQKEVKQHGFVSKQESIALQQSSQILLLLTVNSTADAGVYTGKVFEYLAAGRPILSLGYFGKCVLYDLMHETQAGVHPLSYDELKSQVYFWYQNWKKTGVVSSPASDANVDKYSYRAMAEKFSHILNEAIK